MNFWNDIFNSINGLAGKNHLLDSIMLFSSKRLPYILFATVIVVYLIGIISKNKKLYMVSSFYEIIYSIYI